MNIYDQLQAVEDRYEELGELLRDPEVVSDTKRFMELSREEANTRETVIAYREYKQVIQNISDAEEMIKEASGDADLEEMAKEELKKSKAAKEEYEERLKILLLPKDPNDDKNIILEIEIQGAFNIKKMFPDAVLMFLMPPTAAELENRLRGRGTEDEATIKARLARATQEAEGVEGYDYIVINDTVDACTQRIHEIVTSEKMKASHNLTLIEDIREDLKIYAKGE